ncbi:MAG: hypothetical protein KGM42_19615 [Hyphomicrobiales bacterium]|nr:hypothetical protein [Hyphomicrobiales bacterium]
MSTTLLSLAASVVGGVVVALFSHWMSRQRESEKRLAELRIAHLIECWRKIERAALLGKEIDDQARSDAYDGIDDAVARIKLLGTAQEVELADKFALKLSAGQSDAIVPLLNELRRSLRRELSLEALPEMENIFFRVHRVKK